MKDVSTYIQDFIKDELLHDSKELKQLTSRSVFSNASKLFLKKLYSQLLEAESSWTDQKRAILSSFNSSNHEPLSSKNGSYSSIPSEIRSRIENMPYIIETCNFKVGSRTVDASFLLPLQPVISEHESELTKMMEINQIKKDIHRIYLWLFVANKNAKNKCSKHMNLFFYMTDHIKTKPAQKKEAMNWIHANTAFTTQCSPTTNITLFREEEWFKVFIHETFHNMGLDFSSFASGTQIADRLVLQQYSVNISDLRLYETYCELWAEIMNTMIISYMTTRDKHDFASILIKMEKMLKMEKIWSVFQCVKVLHHHQLRYSDVLAAPVLSRSDSIHRSIYHEKTNAFCYYVLKSILMVHLDEFIQWVAIKNTTLQFKLTDQNTEAYALLVINFYKSPMFLKYVELIEEWYKSNPNNTSFIANTMRMTVNEI